MAAIILGNPTDTEIGSVVPVQVPAYTAEEAVIVLSDGYNPYIIEGGGGGSSDSYWFRYTSGLLRPITVTDKIVIGGTSLLNTESLRVVGKINSTSIQLGSSVTISSILDEDDLISDSNTAVPTQQSVKAYVDAQIGGFLQSGDNISELVNNTGYLTTETDPVFLASPSYGITNTNITNWSLAFGWGDHSIVGYLTAETDPIFVASTAYGIDSTDITNWDLAYTNNHTHTNKTILDGIVGNGLGTSFLADDGQYHLITTTVSGLDTQVQFNDGGSAFGGDSTFTFNKTTDTLNVTNLSISSILYFSGTTEHITATGGDMIFTDTNAGSVSLSDLVTGSTNYWSTTTGGIYYGTGTDKVGINTPALYEALNVNGNIVATDFNSSYLKYKNSNLLLGPNAGDNETGNNFLYISNSDTATPLVKGDFFNQMIEFNADTYINSIKRLCFGSSDVYLRRDGDDLTFSDLNTNSGNPVKLSDFVRDATLYALKTDFTQYSAVTSITNANKTIWNKSSVLITTGGGNSYLSDDGTYKVVTGRGSTTTLYLHDEVSDISGYEKLLSSPANAVEDVETVAVTSGTSPILIDDYATDPSYPGITTISAGLWTFKTWLSVDNVVGTTTVTIRVYKRASGGAETELFNVVTDELNSLTPILYLIETVQPSYTIDATDRIVVKYYASTTTASTINVSLYYEGTAHYSFIITPISFANTIINDAILKWDTSNSYYRPYTTKTEAGGVASAGKFYLGTDTPNASNRLNYDGNLYTTNLNSGSIAASHLNVTNSLGAGAAINSREVFIQNNLGLFGTTLSSNVLTLSRGVSGTANLTGNILQITDNPTTSGTISGALLSATVAATERLRFDPRVTNGASAVASFEDTHNALTTTGAKLKSFRMQGSEKTYIDKDGNVDTVGTFKINGVDIRSTLRLKQSTGLTYNPANPFLFDNDYQYNNYTLTANITPTYSLTGAIALNEVSIIFVGDGTHTVDFSNFVESDLSGTFDITNGVENTVIFYYNGVDVFYSITSNVKLSSSTTTGVLSNTDWNTFNNKQPTLVSGTNIKTINSTSILGSGDIVITAPTPTDNIFDWDGTNNWYAPYTAKQAGMSFYTGTTDPTLTTRLNLDAALRTTTLSCNSSSGYAITGNTNTGSGVYGNASTTGYGVYGISYSGVGVRGFSTSGIGGEFRSEGSTNPSLIAEHNGMLTVNKSANVFEVRRINGSGSTANTTGNLIYILDNPNTSGTISGKVLSATIGTTERISLNPRVADGASAVAYLFDTHNLLNNSTAKIFSFRNGGSEMASITGFGVLAANNINTAQININNNSSLSAHLNLTYNSVLKTQFYPGTIDAGTSIAYMFDTHNNLTTTGAKLASFKNQGVEKINFDKDGSIASKGGLSLNFAQKSANYTLASSDYCIECTANSFIITLPTAVEISGKIYVVKNSGTGTITINPTGAETIDGDSFQSLTQWDSFTFISNGTNWIII